MKVIGRIEKVAFPEWKLTGIDAKIDTGAYTSSLHCHRIERYKEDGKDFVRFNLLDPSHETYNEKAFKLPIFKIKAIKSSNGLTEERIIVKTKIKVFDDVFDAELSLTDRSEMKYPVLIGRKLIRNRFVVDISQKYNSE